MLVVTRKPGESIVIGGEIIVTVCRVDGDRVRIGVDAPKHVAIERDNMNKRKEGEE